MNKVIATEAVAHDFSNNIRTFRAAYTKYGAGRYVGLTVGNEVCAVNMNTKIPDG